MTRERLSVVVCSGTLDQLTSASLLTAGAVEAGMEVELFLTLTGLMGFRQGAAAELYDNAESEPMGLVLLEGLQEQRVPGYIEVLRTARALGRLKIFACALTLRLFRLTMEDLEEIVDGPLTTQEFLLRAQESRQLLHI